jgi:hypothetical protein
MFRLEEGVQDMPNYPFERRHFTKHGIMVNQYER